ncbi:membrane protein YdbS with pleckstrin-like domain [Pseudoxanthomonas japonensis]|jgi:membrane protein YdbS with pleckstrin-like domain|uniref:PH domain-containing protein n=1 Tax=Pseudoxanthomonas TaxID=83618 RepID=UPI000AFB5DD2|nr:MULTISPECIES: PH domain-containing protein [Pseudoxanthomonas]MDR7068293.1 membrane protein YdbS with pleckstrin-like domain [Pseudoxanthomonas japonensis]
MSDNTDTLAVDDMPPADWHALPSRGAWLAALGGAMLVFPVGFPVFFIARATDVLSPWLAVPIAAMAGAAVGAWIAVRYHRRTRWRLDDQGFAVRRGNWWQSETHVPISRVQHLDLKRGPLERKAGLSTLVVHTAGTRMAAVSVSGLDADDAERLRERLATQVDHDDAL